MKGGKNEKLRSERERASQRSVRTRTNAHARTCTHARTRTHCRMNHILQVTVSYTDFTIKGTLPIASVFK